MTVRVLRLWQLLAGHRSRAMLAGLTLVTAALAATVILGMIISSMNQSSAFFNATFVDALRADHTSTLEPLHLDRISQLEPE